MTDISVLDDSIIGYPDSLALFARPIQNIGFRKIRKVAYTVLGGNVASSKVIKFEVHNSGLNYIDLSKTLLKIRAKITHSDGSKIPDIEKKPNGAGFHFKRTSLKKSSGPSEGTNVSTGGTAAKATDTSTSTVATDNNSEDMAIPVIVAPLQNTMHSLFQRVDVKLQDCTLTDSDENYAQLAYMKALQASDEQKKSCLQMQMYFANEGDVDNENINWTLSNNVSFQRRAAAFGGSKEVSMIGRIASPIFDVERLIPNNVKLAITLHPHDSTFCLVSPDIQPQPDYKIVITDAILEVAMVEVCYKNIFCKIYVNTVKILLYMKNY